MGGIQKLSVVPKIILKIQTIQLSGIQNPDSFLRPSSFWYLWDKNLITNKSFVLFRFLDTRVFATCSDDTMVALWDARYIKSRLRTLKGHSNWVKNIEFSYRENCLVTSGFDGAIYLWDINK